jgi:hypothetical protein
MKENFGMRVFSVLLAMMLVSMVIVPVMAAQSQTNGFASDNAVGQVVKVDPLDIEVIENTRTSAIVRVDDVFITLKSNPEHTDAVLEIEDLTTKEKETVHYKVSKKAGQYTTEVYYKGEMINTFVTDYDPLEPGVTGEVLSRTAGATGESTDLASTRASYYYWDGVYFASGYGIKYPHPDYPSYGAQPWDDFYINGNELYHRHICRDTSSTIAELAPTLAGIAIGSRLGGYGALVGGVLGLCLTGSSSAILLDGDGCIWFWDAKDWQYILVPTLPPTFANVPKYFRISSYTLWDDLGIGTP